MVLIQRSWPRKRITDNLNNEGKKTYVARLSAIFSMLDHKKVVGVEVYSTSAFCFQTGVDVAYCSLLILL